MSDRLKDRTRRRLVAACWGRRRLEVGRWSLVDVSEEAELLVMGPHGRNWFAGLTLEATSETVAEHAHSPRAGGAMMAGAAPAEEGGAPVAVEAMWG